MVWGSISSFGVGELIFIDDIMDKNIYLSILKNNFKKSASNIGIGEGFKFYQDNDRSQAQSQDYTGIFTL